MEKSNTTTLLVTGAILAILVTALISSLASESQKKTTLTQATNEAISIANSRLADGGINASITYTVTYPRTGWKADESTCAITAGSYGNTSTTWTPTTDYALSTSGVLSLVNTVAVNSSNSNSTQLTYTYCADDYMASSWGRSILNLTPGLIVIALLIVVVSIVYVLLGKEGRED